MHSSFWATCQTLGFNSILNQASKLISQMAGKKKDIEAYILTF
jgi:hypothetical protein